MVRLPRAFVSVRYRHSTRLMGLSTRLGMSKAERGGGVLCNLVESAETSAKTLEKPSKTLE